MNEAVASLLTDWLIAEVSLAAEFYAVCPEDLAPLRDKAKCRAIELGVVWTDNLQALSEGKGIF